MPTSTDQLDAELRTRRQAGGSPLKTVGMFGESARCLLCRYRHKRHSFVVSRILTWYREGINPQERLPYLATYLGHKDIHSTLAYITITKELLQHASDRFRSFGARVLQSGTGGDTWK
jgi:integrase/recombinase XerD